MKKKLTNSEQDEVNEWLQHIDDVRGSAAREFCVNMLDALGSEELKLHYVRTVSAERRERQRRDAKRTGGRRTTDE